MKFEEILEPLRNGGRVRRKNWKNGVYAKIGKDNVLCLNGGDLPECYWIIKSVELIKTDWEIYHEPILDEEEREYLLNIIRPFKQKVLWVRKQKSGSSPSYGFLVIGLKNAISDICLPPFKANSMYKNMKLDKNYTLEELGL